MSIDWSPLETELARCRSAGMALPVWWRDDDAVSATPALDRLIGIAGHTGVPVHVAVIPARLTPSLVPVLKDPPHAVPMVHGWRHISHAPDGAKKAEFGHPRTAAKAELAQALDRMQRKFGTDLLAVFVPPWNRIAQEFLPVLGDLGYVGLSAFGPRDSARVAKGVVQINTHIDPVFWRGHRGLVDPEVLIAQICATLRARRAHAVDRDEPLGLLTHHLVHTTAVWEFTADVLRVLLDGGAYAADIAAGVQAGQGIFGAD
jgi:hypothetical protein